jgi:hypothetical protein
MNKIHLVSFGILLVCSQISSAADIQFNGFGTMAIGQVFDNEHDYYHYDDNFSIKQDSVFGLQTTVNLEGDLRFIGQLVGRGMQSFEPKIEWAYIDYSISPKLDVYLGRFRIPLFLHSDSLDVGYGYHWIRPPQEVYATPITNLDGISAIYSGSFGDWASRLQLTYGNTSGEANFSLTPNRVDDSDINSTFSGTGGFSWTLFNGGVKARLAYLRVDELTMDIGEINSQVGDLVNQSFALGLNRLGSAIDVEKDSVDFYGAALTYDSEHWFIGAEYTDIDIENSALPFMTNGYITGGWRLSPKILLHSTFSKGKHRPNKEAERYSSSESFDAAIHLINDINTRDYSSVMTGIRYDFHAQAALKFEYLHFDEKRVQNSAEVRNRVNLLRMAVDVVF